MRSIGSSLREEITKLSLLLSPMLAKIIHDKSYRRLTSHHYTCSEIPVKKNGLKKQEQTDGKIRMQFPSEIFTFSSGKQGEKCPDR